MRSPQLRHHHSHHHHFHLSLSLRPTGPDRTTTIAWIVIVLPVFILFATQLLHGKT